MKHHIYLHSVSSGDEFRRELQMGNHQEEFTLDGVRVKLQYCFDQQKIKAEFQALDGDLTAIVSGLETVIPDWQTENYLLLPAAVYDGNRSEIRADTYPPINEPGLVELDPPLHTSHIAHFDRNGGGVIEQTTGDVSFPGVGYYSPGKGISCWYLTPCRNELGNYGYTLTENTAGRELIFVVNSPVYRRWHQLICRPVPANDPAGSLNCGDKISFDFRIFCREADSISCLFNHMTELRNEIEPAGSHPAIYPLSQADKLIKEKYLRSNWDEESGYLMTDVDVNSPNFCSHWQLGWIGGGIASLNMICDEDPRFRKVARKDLETLLERAQAKSGLFYGVAKHGKYYGDAFREVIPGNRVLLRKNADALFFIPKHFILLEENGENVPGNWKKSLERLARAFIGIWKKYGQFGQWVDVDTAEIITGGSASAVMAIGGLALCSQYYNCKEMLDTAEDAAAYYVHGFLEKGILNGCPAEIMQACDSEAGAAMLESMVTLWEITGKTCYLEWAEMAARYCMSWCVSYDYKFPADSPFGKLDMKSCGTVWANVQNKHSAPGFCTSSGSALLRLFRATGKRMYMDLIRDIAHALPQCVSRPERQISNLKTGWINERVNLSDWEGPGMVGNVFYGSCWPEVSLMLSYLELPGVYALKDTGEVWMIDHVEAHWEQNELVVSNPTDFTAKVKILVEDSRMAVQFLPGHNPAFKCVEIPAGEKIRLEP